MVLRNVRRASTGEPLVLLDENAVTQLELDFTDFLETGETISSASVTYTGVTGSTSTSSPRVTLTLSAATAYTDDAGKATYVVTFSSGEIFRGILRVRRTSRYADEQVFRDYT